MVLGTKGLSPSESVNPGSQLGQGSFQSNLNIFVSFSVKYPISPSVDLKVIHSISILLIYRVKQYRFS